MTKRTRTSMPRPARLVPSTRELAGLILTTALGLAGPALAQGPCQRDTDCDMGSVCVFDDIPDDARGCDGDCNPPAPATGSCKSQPMACENDADCPLGLTCPDQETHTTCQTNGNGGSNCTTETVSVSHPVCAFQPTPCQDDEDCGVSYECGESSGANNGLCFPVRQDCESSADCPDNYLCISLPDGARAQAPAGWEGADRVCLPEGIAMIVDGTAEVARSGEAQTASKSEGLSAGIANADASGNNQGGVAAGGCSIRGLGHDFGSNGFALGLAALLGLGRIKRRRERPNASSRRSPS